MHGGISALHADGKQLGDFFGHSQEARHRLEGATEVIGIEPGDDYPLSCISHTHANIDQTVAEELAFIDTYYFGSRLDFFEDLGRVSDDLRRKFEPGMRDDVRLRVALVNHRLEDLHAL